MLPDFLETKEKLRKRLNSQLEQERLSHLGPFADISTIMIFEGDKTITIHEDGSVQETKLEKIIIERQIDLAEVEKMNHEMVLDEINSVSKEMAGKQKELFYETIDKAIDEAGNVVSADGKPFSVDLLLEVLEGVDLDFDEEGQPSGFRLVAHPKFYPSIKKVISQAESDPRYQALMERKREEWRVRENNRELVG